MFGSKFRFVLVAVIALSAAAVLASWVLTSPVTVVYSANRVPTIKAKTELDAIYMLGYLHAKDRFFQMDVQRHLFSGTLAEMFGPAVIAQDVELRTLGLKRAAQRSEPLQTPEVTAWLEAYSDGVNAWLEGTQRVSIDDESCSSGGVSSDSSNDGHSESSSDDRDWDSGDSNGPDNTPLDPLPPEYAALELDRAGIAPWTPLDSLIMVKGLAFSLSFDLSDIDRTIALLTYRAVEGPLGINGLQLAGVDLFPTSPFDFTPTIDPNPAPPANAGPNSTNATHLETPAVLDALQEYRDRAAECPILLDALERDSSSEGSNWFIASGALTASGNPLIANDPHLSLDTPSTFYEAHLQVKNGINVTGSTFPGAPGVVIGCNDTICWGATVNPMDVTDIYQEVMFPFGTPNFTHTIFEGAPEPLQFIPQVFQANIIGNTTPNDLTTIPVPAESGGVTLIVPRRNNGPIAQVRFDPTSATPFTAFSIQYTGWSGTRELEAFRQFARAASPQDFADGLQYFDVGSQNWAYADINGNIAYWTSAEMPLREDLQFPTYFPDGLQPPYFIRDGTHTLRHEWVAGTPTATQAIPYEILPFEEMPQSINPPSGLLINANNDPIGTTFDNISWNEFRPSLNGFGAPSGRLYLGPDYAPGFRQGRLRKLFDEALANGPLTVQDFKDIQGNNQLLDAEFFTPYALDAFNNAQTATNPILIGLASDPRVVEAVGRLSNWDYSTPTGINEGWDPSDTVGISGPPSQAEIDASVAATIYSVWRGQLVQRVIDATLGGIDGLLGGPVLAPTAPGGSALPLITVQRLLLSYPIRGGSGQSNINFFYVPGVSDQDEARDIILLGTLQSALDKLASADFADAFANSTMQDDYRWGKLHRIVLDHPLGGPFNIPPTGGPGNLALNLPGFSRAGGLGAVDASSHAARADSVNEFMFGSGPSRRFVAEMTPSGPQAVEVLPGGESGVPGSPYQTDQLNLWLANEYHPLPLTNADVQDNAVACRQFLKPAPPLAGGVGPEESATGIFEPILSQPREEERGAAQRSRTRRSR